MNIFIFVFGPKFGIHVTLDVFFDMYSVYILGPLTTATTLVMWPLLYHIEIGLTI